MNVNVDAIDTKLSDIQEMNVFRIAQEALTNVIKHAEATKIWLTLKNNGETIVLQVKDNGKGFDVPRKRNLLKASRFGIVGIMERARIAGGNVKVESADGQGTTVTVVVPISA